MVFRSFAGFEYGKSGGGTIPFSECNLVDGVFGTGWLARGYVSLCAAAFLGSVERRAACNLSVLDDHRRSVSSGPGGGILFCGRSAAMGWNRFGSYHAF